MIFRTSGTTFYYVEDKDLNVYELSTPNSSSELADSYRAIDLIVSNWEPELIKRVGEYFTITERFYCRHDTGEELELKTIHYNMRLVSVEYDTDAPNTHPINTYTLHFYGENNE